MGRRFMLGGLCSGAYWSFHAALLDERVPAVLLLNPRALVWDAGLGPGRDLRALFTQRPSLAKIRRLGISSPSQAASMIRADRDAR